MMLKVLIFSLVIAAVAARPADDGNQKDKVLVNGEYYDEFPLNGNCEPGVTYYHYGFLCECKSPDNISCERATKQ